ncbi:hypothetical protein EYS09_04960 [Streptomyces kasugaensis]|uniref:Transposase IS4 N-terminal domain-containing protein n=1 Tax=Streptomyces kasugaensis TaxID=1946 RepID=A0A4Q9HZK3_STRKA|nr:hypothetical protein EYS09_04960 [Streptomyces kasugaensis]
MQGRVVKPWMGPSNCSCRRAPWPRSAETGPLVDAVKPTKVFLPRKRPPLSRQCATAVLSRTIQVADGVFAPGHLGKLTQHAPFELVDDVLARTHMVEKRLRRLPSCVGMHFRRGVPRSMDTWAHAATVSLAAERCSCSNSTDDG